MKLGQKLKPAPTHVHEETSLRILPYLPDMLDAKLTYRVTAIKRNRFGLLVKTDRLNEWVNSKWFQIAN